jgi:periplasmic divalent cation tolerance protein
MKAIFVFTTVADLTEADRLAKTLVESRLAACVNRIGPLQSTYRWNETIEISAEYLLIVKSEAERYPDIERLIREHHSYAVPEIVSVALHDLEPNYRHWLESAVIPAETSS